MWGWSGDGSNYPPPDFFGRELVSLLKSINSTPATNLPIVSARDCKKYLLNAKYKNLLNIAGKKVIQEIREILFFGEMKSSVLWSPCGAGPPVWCIGGQRFSSSLLVVMSLGLNGPEQKGPRYIISSSIQHFG